MKGLLSMHQDRCGVAIQFALPASFPDFVVAIRLDDVVYGEVSDDQAAVCYR